MRGTGGMVGQYALPDRSYGHKWVDIRWIGWDQRYSYSRANGYDGMVGGGNMGTRWKSLGEGVDWLLLGFFCLFSTPSGGRKSLPFFVDFCGTQAPKQWRKAQRLFFCGILSGVAGCVQRLLQHILAKLSPLLIDIGSSFQLNQFLVAKKYFGF